MMIKDPEQKYIKNGFDNLKSSIENEDEHVIDVKSMVEDMVTEEMKKQHPLMEHNPPLPDYDEYSPFSRKEHDRLQRIADELSENDELHAISEIERLQRSYSKYKDIGLYDEAEKMRQFFNAEIDKRSKEKMRMYNTSTFNRYNPDTMSYITNLHVT